MTTATSGQSGQEPTASEKIDAQGDTISEPAFKALILAAAPKNAR
ncbi:hypothetical protein [Achromobacter sp. ESBL13]